MTPRKPPPKTPKQLAEEHWAELEPVLFTQMKLTMRLTIDAYIKGYNRRKEDELDRVRPVIRKK